MPGRKRRDCGKCIAYCNMLDGVNYTCGLGFEVSEDMERGRNGSMKIVPRPFEDKCESIPQPKTKEDFVRTAASLGIEWDIEDVMSIKEFNDSLW